MVSIATVACLIVDAVVAGEDGAATASCLLFAETLDWMRRG